MQRLAGVLIMITAACGSGTSTGAASMTGTPVKSAAAYPFSGVEGGGQAVLGWKIELFENDAGSDCTSDGIKVIATLGIYTNQLEGTKPQAILQTGGISIVTESPPTVIAGAAANMGVEGVSNVVGQVIIDVFHLTPDVMTADRIEATINAGGTEPGTGTGIALTGTFVAPLCE